MVYNTGLLGFGLFPSSGILENRKHDVSETGSVFRPQMSSPPSPEEGNRSSFRNVVFYML
jgi:hypothetical protein